MNAKTAWIKDKAFASFAAGMFSYESIFLFAVWAYKANPTKAKAIAIYDNFCLDTPYQINANQFLLPGQPIHNAILELKTQREQARKMNFLRRVATSGGRKPPTTIFDALEAAVQGVKNEDSIGDMVAKYNNNKGVSQNISGSERAAATLSAKLRAAGFSSNDTGI
jgi:hypothetical protein